MSVWYKSIVPTVTLFSSVGTLLCCALPALLVSVGAGAAVIGLVSTFPQLIWLSEHKIGLFVFAGVMLAASATGRYAARNAPCPIDPQQAKACIRLRRTSAWIFYFSLGIYGIGFFFAFIARYLI